MTQRTQMRRAGGIGGASTQTHLRSLRHPRFHYFTAAPHRPRALGTEVVKFSQVR